LYQCIYCYGTEGPQFGDKAVK